MKKDIEKLRTIFESISCLCAEGPEFCTKLELTDAIQKDAMKGYNFCKRLLSPNNPVELTASKKPNHSCKFCQHLAMCVCE